MPKLKVESGTKATFVDIEFGIFRARIVNDTIDNDVTVEIGSIGGWNTDGTQLFTKSEFNHLMVVLKEAESILFGDDEEDLDDEDDELDEDPDDLDDWDEDDLDDNDD